MFVTRARATQTPWPHAVSCDEVGKREEKERKKERKKSHTNGHIKTGYVISPGKTVNPCKRLDCIQVTEKVR